jgi:hypothetical protein
MPRAVLLSIRAYMCLAVPEPEVLRIIGKESKLKGTNRLSAAQIDKVIKPPGIPSVDDPRSGSYAAVFRFAAADTTTLVSITSLLAVAKPARFWNGPMLFRTADENRLGPWTPCFRANAGRLIPNRTIH